MSAVCIKTQILNSFKDLMTGLFIVKTVKLNPIEIPRADDVSIRPICCIFDDDETDIEESNRYRRAMIPLVFETWLHVDKQEDMSAELDEMLAQQYKALKNPAAAYHALIKGLKEGSPKKLYASENDCCAIYPINVIYQHASGDPYTINPS